MFTFPHMKEVHRDALPSEVQERDTEYLMQKLMPQQELALIQEYQEVQKLMEKLATLTPQLVKEPVNNQLDIQIGGSHYKKFKIQPLEFCTVNEIPFPEGSIIKYILRDKGCRLQDLQKARHILDYLIEVETKE